MINNNKQITYVYNAMMEWNELYNNCNNPKLKTTYYMNYIKLKMVYDSMS